MVNPATWFPDGGEMGERVRNLRWDRTPIGPVETWPQSLRTAVRIILDSRYPMFVWWGEELINIYNDSYIEILGQRHPAALGRPAKAIWSDIWDAISPLVRTVVDENRATFNTELELFMERNGYVEETFFTFSYSPLHDPESGSRGLFCACTEDTERVVGERRLRLLSSLGGSSRSVHTVPEALDMVERALIGYGRDVAFALIYQQSAERPGELRLAKLAGAEAAGAIAPASVLLAADEQSVTEAAEEPIGGVLRTVYMDGQARLLDAAAVGQPMPGGEWPEPAQHVMVLPLTRGGEERIGALVLGAGPRRPFDDAYRQFFELIANSISSLISNADAYENERRRADSLAELDRAKTVFFGNVSHEFRTPLTLMMAPIEELLLDARQRNENVEPLEIVRRNGLRLVKLVNTMLDFSRIEAGRITADYEPVDLAVTTAELASMFRSAVESAGLRLNVECEPLGEWAYVDRDMWEKIVMNLLSNALKYTLQGEIGVALRRVDEVAVELTVSDTGIGIPEQELPKVFERFHRIQGAHGRTQEGTGIGLALVRELCHLHGGEVSVQSKLGEGSVFRVTLPLGKAHLPADRVTESPRRDTSLSGVDLYLEEALRWLPEGSTATAELGLAGPEAATEANGRPTVLVADDNADMRAYLRRLLQGRYHVVLAADGRRAAALAEKKLPALVLSDVMMPGLDGFELLARLRADPATRSIPVVLLSARAGEEASSEGLEAGADDYIVKPFHARELLARIGAQIELAGVRRGAEARITDLLEGSTSGFVTLDSDGRYQYVNPTAEKLLGRSRHQMLGCTPEEVFPESVGTQAIEMFRRALASGVAESTETFFEPWDRWFRVKLDPTKQGGVTVQFDDITLARRALETMRETDRRKDEFLATLAHELRNPLAPIRNALQLLLHDPAIDTDRMYQMMERQVDHLTRLVDDLMEVSRINRGMVELRIERMDIAAAVESACESVRPEVARRSQSLEVSLPSTALYVDGDSVRLTQVIANLLGNASKYTHDGGNLRLSVAATDATVEVVVEDDGIGIPEDQLQSVFRPFLQAGKVPSRNHGGLGLGLTVVQQLVEHHDGTVKAESAGEGHGSRFTVSLPRRAPADPRRPVEKPAPALRPSALRVVVVDDNRDSADSMAMLLKVKGCDVRVAYDGTSALETVADHDPAVVLLDIGLPDIDGIEVARRLRVAENERRTLVALTGWGQDSDRERSAAAGFDHHLVKPADWSVVDSILAEHEPLHPA